MSPATTPVAPFVVGVDLGGTTVEVGLVGADGRAAAVRRLDTRSWRPRDAVMADLAAAVTEVAAEAPDAPAAVGLGVPATFDDRGTLRVMPNFREGWTGHAVAPDLAARTGLPCALVNDARAFALAEAAVGAGRGCAHVFGVILGTGVGGGAVLGGRLHLGHGGQAGELGHHIVDPHGLRCGCGSRGCLETVASAPALVASVARPFLHGRTPRLFDLAGGSLDRLDARLVAQAAREGDEECRRAVARVGATLGVATANVVTLLAPERIVVGGGLAGASDLLFPAVRESWERYARVAEGALPELVRAELDHPGLVGAALWARSGLEPGAGPTLHEAV